MYLNARYNDPVLANDWDTLLLDVGTKRMTTIRTGA